MAKKKLRTIVVDGQTYLWKFVPNYRRTGNSVEPLFVCDDTFTAYAADCRASPIHIRFETYECVIMGGPLRVGTMPVLLNDMTTTGVNLHLPSWAETLIRYGLTHGWQPEQSRHPLTIENGLEVLAALQYRAHGDKSTQNS